MSRILSWILIFIVLIIYNLDKETLNTCLKDVESQDFIHERKLGFNPYHFTQFSLYLHIGFTIMMFKEKLIKIRLFIFLWFIFSNLILQELKHTLGDYNCGRNKYNSISGHFNYIIFNLLSLLWFEYKLCKSLKIDKQNISQILTIAGRILITWCFIINSFILGYETYINGYHSLIQLAHGVLFGVISFNLNNIIIIKCRKKNNMMIPFITSLIIQYSIYILLSEINIIIN